MKALLWDGSRAQVVDRNSPAPSTDRAIVRVALAGICNTDLEITRGYMGFRGVLGHEFVGTVESGPAAWLGKRAVGEINFACGECQWCVRDLGRHCPSRSVMGILAADGALAERVSVPVANLHLVPDSLSDEQAVFTEPLAAAFEILSQVPDVATQRCVVLGDGKLGLLVAQVLQAAGGEVLAVGRHPEKLAHLARRGIATVTDAEWDRAPAAVVVDATGSAAGFAAALLATTPRGTLVLKSTVAARSPVDLAAIVINEINVVGSRCGLFPPAIAALHSRDVEVAPLISARLPLARATEALDVASQRGTLKVLVDCR